MTLSTSSGASPADDDEPAADDMRQTLPRLCDRHCAAGCKQHRGGLFLRGATSRQRSFTSHALREIGYVGGVRRRAPPGQSTPRLVEMNGVSMCPGASRGWAGQARGVASHLGLPKSAPHPTSQSSAT